MGYYSELAAELQEPQKNPRLAELLGITFDELEQMEYNLIPNKESDKFDGIYSVEIDTEKTPQEIINKIKNLENGCRVYVNAIDLEYDDDCDNEIDEEEKEVDKNDELLKHFSFGKTIITDKGIKFSFLATERELDFSKLWRLLGNNEKDYVFDILYHIGTKDISDDDYNDFCVAYLQALKLSKNKDFAIKSPVYGDYQKCFMKTVNNSGHNVNMCIVIDESDLLEKNYDSKW
ncbi:MAG: hypothetical protein LBN93_01910 [Candidatus Symbiothrix sp.]|jgi:hypothetical protein|nr:hypothetical protein [Candidatus Symbiothrix sp.]